MASSLNKVQLIGNLGADPEIRAFQNGGKVANLRMATSETWKDKATGERKERTQWHSIAIFSEPLVRLTEQYIKKGSKLYIEGQLETRKWQDQSGNDRYTTEVVLRPYSSKMVMLDGRKNSDQNGGGYEQQNNQGGGQGNQGGGYQHQGSHDDGYRPAAGGQQGYGGGGRDLDDDIPF